MNLNSKDKEEYWNKRSEQRIVDAENLTTDMLKKLKKTYEKAYLELEKEINAFYGKYSTETGLDITEVRKRLDPKELKTFKEQLKQYYDEVKRLGGYSKDTKEYLRELSAKAYISRLDALQAQLRFQIETLYRQVNLDVSDSLQDGYKETYYKTTFDNQKGIGFAYSFNALDDNKVKVAISQNWQGSNFSDRIWNDKNKLIETINQKIPQGVALGQNPRKVARDIAKSLDTRYSNCERLARTEMNHIANESQKLAYKETPEILQQYKILATLDNRTSEICFVGTDKVQTVSDVEKLFKRNYTGKIITITTATGNQITGTPNHPILTPEGWLPLDKINPNKHIVYSILDDTVGIISKKNVHVPTKLSKLFNSIREITVGKIQTTSSSTTKFNNNRTIRNGKINILSTDRILRNWRQTIFNKHIIKDFFTFIHNSINLFCLRVLSKFFFTRELVNMTSEVKIFTFSKLIKPTFRPIKFFNNFSWFNSIIEHINSSNSISVISTIMFAPLKLWHNPEFFKNICNSRSRSFILFCNFASGHTIPVFADNVIDKRCEFTNNCQVYNLQTSDNTYINNKIIVHNCQEQDGKVYKMSEWEEGITAPPFHPNCYDNITEVYTNNGWKLFKDCTLDDEFLSVLIDQYTITQTYLKAKNLIKYKNNGTMYHLKNKDVDLCVTKDHNLYVNSFKNAIPQLIPTLLFIKFFNEYKSFNDMQYQLFFLSENFDKISLQDLQISEIPYNDYVYCIELPKYHTLLVRRNGKVCWCGNCRTTTIPYFEDMPIDEYGRIATDYSTGQAYYLPSNMTYKEWRASLTEKQDKYFIADKKIREQHSTDKQQLAEYRKLQTKNPALFEGMPKTLKEYQEYKYLQPEKYEILKQNARIVRSEMK